MSRAHKPATTKEIISFCRNNVKLLEELSQICNEPWGGTIDDNWKKVHIEWNRRRCAKANMLITSIRETFNFKDPWGAVWRILAVYEKNIKLIKGITVTRKPGYYWVKCEFNGITDWILCDYLGEGVWFHVGECINGRELEVDETPIARK